MAAITPTKRSQSIPTGGTIVEFYGTSASNQADTFTTPAVPKGGAWKLTKVTVTYDNTPTYTGTALTVFIDSGINAIYDVQLAAGTDNGRYTAYIPSGAVWLQDGDAVLVNAPAGGANIEASVVVTLEAY